MTGEGRTLAKLVFARYRAGRNANVGFNSNPNASVWWTQHDWSDPNGSGVWEPGEEGRLRRRRGGMAAESLDPALQLPVLDEAGALGRTRAAGRHRPSDRRRLAARAVPVRAAEHQSAVRARLRCRSRFATPDPTGSPGTPDDGATFVAYDLRPDFFGVPAMNVVRNVPGSTQRYWTWEIEATRRAQGRWSLGAGFAHTWSRDQASGYSEQPVRNNTYPLTPNDLINAGADGRHTSSRRGRRRRTARTRRHGVFASPRCCAINPGSRSAARSRRIRASSATRP